jgi:hypothetical protein
VSIAKKTPITLAASAVAGVAANMPGDFELPLGERFQAELAAFNSILIAQALDRLTDAVKSMDGTLYTAGLPDGHPEKIV